MQIIDDTLMPAKYRQKDWPSERIDQVADMARNRGVN